MILTSAGTVLFPRRMPAQECRVRPPILRAAIPVAAVTAMLSPPYSFRPQEMILRRSTDLPAPAGPVKKMFSPRLTLFKMASCSAESSMTGS
ncbi:hypothetical protein BDW22DRAFT_1392416 [Trametopsis cervina]|nr:hypothetical protein BDW22DRAFT_1392416 [Trametopsis cervina]